MAAKRFAVLTRDMQGRGGIYAENLLKHNAESMAQNQHDSLLAWKGWDHKYWVVPMTALVGTNAEHVIGELERTMLEEARCTVIAHEEDGEPIFASERAGGNG